MTRLATFLLIAAAVMAGPANADIVRKESPYSVMETIDRLEAAIKERKLSVFARIDHAAAAKQANLELRSTLLIIFGSAAVGTPLMQAQQTMGLSLPLKALAWQDAAGKVWLGYDAPSDLAKERGVPADHPAIGRITAALAAMADAAVKR